MSTESDTLVAKAQEKIRNLEAEIAKAKDFVNQIRQFEGQAPLYADTTPKSDGNMASLRGDRFYRQPLATALRDILEMRRAADLGPATINSLYDALIAGGYNFEAANDQNAKSSLRTAMRKNPVFHKLPNGGYGLSEWYGNPKRKKTNGENDAMQEGESDDDSEEDAQPVEKPEFVKPR